MTNTSAPTAAIAPGLDIAAVRRDFPVLERQVDGRPIVYLDSAATSLKPRAVIEAIVEFYEHYTANINRGVHLLSEEASERFEEARQVVADFVNASEREIVFVRNTTEAINLVAANIPDDMRVAYLTGEHHSNFLPWYRRGNSVGIAIQPDGRVDLKDLERVLEKDRPGLLAVGHVTNALGAVNPLHQIIERAHAIGCEVLVDGSQSVPHRPVDVRQLNCDYLCFSGHKMSGPSGVGVLYARREHLERFAPTQYGGDMVDEVHLDGFELQEAPWRFEAGTPHIEGVIGLAAACRYLDDIGMDAIAAHESALVRHALACLGSNSRVRLHGPTDSAHRGGAITFTVPGIEAHGVARILSNRHNIFIRSGFHCAQPMHEQLGIPPTARASMYLYNTVEEIDLLGEALDQVASLHYR